MQWIVFTADVPQINYTIITLFTDTNMIVPIRHDQSNETEL